MNDTQTFDMCSNLVEKYNLANADEYLDTVYEFQTELEENGYISFCSIDKKYIVILVPIPLENILSNTENSSWTIYHPELKTWLKNLFSRFDFEYISLLNENLEEIDHLENRLTGLKLEQSIGEDLLRLNG